MKPEYEHLKEEPREVYLSSAFWKSSWIWGLIKQAAIGTYKGEATLFSADYSLTLKHGIRTKKQLLREKQKLDDSTFSHEYRNVCLGGSESVFFSFELVSEAQRLKKAWYPKTTEEFFENKKNRVWDIPKQKGEIRVVSMDVALSASSSKTKNDNTVIKCIRGLVSGENYERQEVYTETFEGRDTLSQSIRVRQIMEVTESLPYS